MYAASRPDFVPEAWHVFVTWVITTWIACPTVIFFNSGMPHLNSAGIFFIVAGFFVTIITVYVAPSRPQPTLR